MAYVLGITRVDPIRHELLFERFINEGRTSYPDVDIDFASSRREEVIQYVYERYGPEHTGMVCNVVTYRARSAVREVGVALGFPRPLVDRVAKALETYDSVMVRRDLETEGGFAEFFRRRAGPSRRAGEAAAEAGRWRPRARPPDGSARPCPWRPDPDGRSRRGRQRPAAHGRRTRRASRGSCRGRARAPRFDRAAAPTMRAARETRRPASPGWRAGVRPP